MSDWRDKLRGSGVEIQEASAESMAAHRVMKSLGLGLKDIGRMCSRFDIPYIEDESPFIRAVSIFRSVYSEASLVEIFDAKSGKKRNSIIDELLEDTHTAIVFYRIAEDRSMTAFVKGKYLYESPLGKIVIKPGIKYIDVRDGMQLWEQDPVTLLKSFARDKEDV